MTEHFCTIHDTKFFKSSNMKGYAHPVKDEDGNDVLNAKGKQAWCNEEDMESYHPVNTAPVNAIAEEAVKRGAEVTSTDKMSKADWAEKEARTRDSIERQKALDCAVHWCAAKVQAGVEIKTTEVTTVAVKFEAFIKTGLPGS